MKASDSSLQGRTAFSVKIMHWPVLSQPILAMDRKGYEELENKWVGQAIQYSLIEIGILQSNKSPEDDCGFVTSSGWLIKCV